MATAAKNAGLSSCRSRWYARGRPLSSVSIAVSAPITPAERPRTSSAGSGFFLLGIIELPVENASATRTKPNRGFDHQVSSSASRERWTIARAAAASTSTTKSRSATASIELRVTPSKPSSAAVASRSSG